VKKANINFTSEKTGELSYKILTKRLFISIKDSLKFINQFTFIDSSLVLQSKTVSEEIGRERRLVTKWFWADTETQD